MLRLMVPWRYVLVLLLLGCGGATKREPMELGEPEAAPSEPPPPPSPPLAPRTCDDAAANVTLITQHVTSGLGPSVGVRCQADRWAPEVVQCFALAADGPGLSLCAALLPPEQQRALESQSVQVVRGGDPACTELAARPVVPAPSPSGAGAAADGQAISAKELEQLRQAGETQLEPAPAERRLMAQCRLARIAASFKVCIDGSGVPTLVDLARSSRLPGYDEKLANAIAAWRYRPYLAEGRAVAACSTVTFVYSLPPG